MEKSLEMQVSEFISKRDPYAIRAFWGTPQVPGAKHSCVICRKDIDPKEKVVVFSQFAGKHCLACASDPETLISNTFANRSHIICESHRDAAGFVRLFAETVAEEAKEALGAK